MGHTVILLNFRRNRQTAFPQHLHDFAFPPATSEGSNFATSLLLTLVVSKVFVCLSVFILAISAGVKWDLIVVLMCISLITNDIDQLFMYLLAICTSPVEEGLESFGHLKIWLYVLLLFSCGNIYFEMN